MTPPVSSIVCALRINIFAGGILSGAEDIYKQKTYNFTWYVFHLLLIPMDKLYSWFLKWIYAASTFSLPLFLGLFLQCFQQLLNLKLFLGDIMCYQFLNYLFSGHFLNKTVDVFQKKKKKIFMQGDFNLQVLHNVFRRASTSCLHISHQPAYPLWISNFQTSKRHWRCLCKHFWNDSYQVAIHRCSQNTLSLWTFLPIKCS